VASGTEIDVDAICKEIYIRGCTRGASLLGEQFLNEAAPHVAWALRTLDKEGSEPWAKLARRLAEFIDDLQEQVGQLTLINEDLNAFIAEHDLSED
jgi:hypothetical protein